jgi:hypothetical protein
MSALRKHLYSFFNGTSLNFLRTNDRHQQKYSFLLVHTHVRRVCLAAMQMAPFREPSYAYNTAVLIQKLYAKKGTKFCSYNVNFIRDQ